MPTKSKDFAYGIDPWITTIDEFNDVDAIPMEVRVNGQTWGKGDSSNKLWTVEQLLAWVSLGERIEPGDVIGSGTMGGGLRWSLIARFHRAMSSSSRRAASVCCAIASESHSRVCGGRASASPSCEQKVRLLRRGGSCRQYMYSG